ncbi:MAG: rod shape-determining protein RodA [Verrucomicrobia bacterium]|nr:rod shape-determining protein RodA [Verrucomicrobiota bacterium]
MTPLFRKFLSMNWLLLVNMLGLLIWGIYAIYNASAFRVDEPVLAMKWRSQAQWAGLGLIIFLIVTLIDYKWVRWGAWGVYIIGILGLIAVKLFGVEMNGDKSRLVFGSLQVQPSQIAIVGTILVLAVVLGDLHRIIPAFRHHWLRLLVSGLLAVVPMAMVLKQPDLGSAAVYGPVVVSMLLVASIPFRYLISLTLIVLTVVPLAYFFGLKPYQKARVEVFYKVLTNQKVNIRGDAYMANNIQLAVGSAGLDGKGPMSEKVPERRSIHRTLFSKTESINDFIFAVIIEEFGFQGAVLQIAATALLVLQCIFVAFYARDHVGRLIAIGVVGMLAAHSLQNMGMILGVMPITGIPLPFISYGGTFLVVCFFLMGMIQSIWIHRELSPVQKSGRPGEMADDD